jgi:glycosyltransferase involved in cell wall biosynthesis
MKEYSLVIASNFMDHYMLALSNELKEYFRDFCFVASERLEENYKKLGFADLNDQDFVFKAYEDKEKARQIVLDADIVITGSYVYQSHIRERMRKKKPTIYYSERLFKTDNPIGKVLRFIKYNFRHGLDKRSPLLCVSAYAAGDYNSIGLFKNRTYQFGYFPLIKKYEDVDELIRKKKHNSIIWVGRLIEWKHPDHAIEVARRLRDEGYDFSMEMIGNGPMKEELHKKLDDLDLNDKVTMFDSGMSPEEVRRHMEEAEIYLFTSDRGEGWGVVLNEALNSACACVASYSAGSTPFLLEDGVNGFSYRDENVDVLYEKVKELLNDEMKKSEFSLNAYKSIIEEWNCEAAAERIYQTAKCIMNGEDYSGLYEKGIMSKAVPINHV